MSLPTSLPKVPLHTGICVQQQAQEMAECSFSPKTRRLPAYIRDMARASAPTTPRTADPAPAAPQYIYAGSGGYAL